MSFFDFLFNLSWTCVVILHTFTLERRRGHHCEIKEAAVAMSQGWKNILARRDRLNSLNGETTKNLVG